MWSGSCFLLVEKYVFLFFFHFPKTEKLVVPYNNPALKVFHEMLDGLD